MFKAIFSKTIVFLLVLAVAVIFFYRYGASSEKTDSLEESTNSTSSANQNVPLPSREDIVRTFCSLIDEGRISEAVSMMDIGDDAVRQSWAVSLNNFSSFKLISAKKSAIDDSGNSYEVDLDIVLKKDLSDLPMPNYGWTNGVNKKWINLVEKESGKYKISEIATGP